MKTLLFVLLLLIPMSANADAKLELCTKYTEFARVVMQARQANAPIEQVWPAASDEVMQAIVIAAWKKPLWSTAPYKNDAVQEFTSQIFLSCMENAK